MAVVRALRAAGHDFLAVREVMPGVLDEVVIDLAMRDKRILVTEDKDFGQLVHAQSVGAPGVVLLRYPSTARQSIAADVLALATSHGPRLAGCFAIVEPGRIRVSRSRPAG
jgi:predicted nuclease of predicted toxin-antitoxin system